MGFPVKTFFICALPRSRTSWLANFLTFGDAFCLHEPLVGIRSLTELRGRFEATGRPIVGSSDCGNQYFADALAEEFPGSQFIVVNRPIEDCQKSMDDIGHPDHGTLIHSRYLLDEVIKNHAPLVLDFSELSQPDTGEEICDFLGLQWDRPRFDMLTTLHIQPLPEWINSQVNMKNIDAADTLARSV